VCGPARASGFAERLVPRRHGGRDDDVQRAINAARFGEKGVIGSLGTGAIHVSMSTISVALAERITVAHANTGQRFVAAPVFGRPEAAAESRLSSRIVDNILDFSRLESGRERWSS
jgi:hypothetical protein